MVQMSEYEYYNSKSAIQLSPFVHQVGGHSSMFQYDKNTICKLMSVHECNFYQTVPEILKGFVAAFRGSITVQYIEDKLGYIKLVAQPSVDNDQDVPPAPENILRKSSVQLRCTEDGHVDYSNGSGVDIANYEQGKITMSRINPWSLQLCKKQAEKLHRQLIGDENSTVLQEYILLENVTAKFEYPCILDLKMGKRHYADIDSDKKRQSKIQKSEQSTSSKLGVRLCGMQVYQVESSRYIFTDKYRGRTFDIGEFRLALVQYLDNGREKRFDILPELIQRLESLYSVISSLNQYRFYSGSLLIVYDGAHQSNSVDVRMIDFANSIRAGIDESAKNHPGPDKGYLYGLERLIIFFKEILNENQKN